MNGTEPIHCTGCGARLPESWGGEASVRTRDGLIHAGACPSLPAPPDRAAPIPMRLTCPECGELHVDAGEFATKPHHTHACQHCGMVWRPAIGPTVGVRFLPGFKDAAPPITTTGERK